ncbi:MAG: 16S rRNA (cytosine(1402)-N(4))-methyltransferase [Gammaproteobacteria bacterium CG11_big_fil_rev_8_21_14_0_20_46_22]|nr:MAG: 16S rRNA (cytosine(1402)-N(4))-methyltransferase [Gammaproteobacteria bacterium CG12_big_fil_rev_8_21_14_0_65_46_12]PIR11903.1 MAG: 16S rRNA (cytosine(1402)-N(4))-methyltransferase [Gammaproteobacteria bacterium CG11_big_fil_rev_8_21_14_0_20_46_22]
MHKPVLLDETLTGLLISPSGVYIDATFGRGGHSHGVREGLMDGRLIVIDKDPEAIATAKERYEHDPQVSIHHGSFAEIKRIANSEGILGRVDGIMMDLGVSSPQLDVAERGFSFLRDGPLDMRMNTTTGQTAKEYLEAVEEAELARVLKDYGEERFARRLANVIKANIDSLQTTKALADLVEKTIPTREFKKHPATRTFQALRIAVNNELDDLETVLRDSIDCLKPGGRLCCISFHSLEDRIVKQFMKREATPQALPAGLPIKEADIEKTQRLMLVGKAIRASESEVKLNPRARSATLRIAEKL